MLIREILRRRRLARAFVELEKAWSWKSISTPIKESLALPIDVQQQLNELGFEIMVRSDLTTNQKMQLLNEEASRLLSKHQPNEAANRFGTANFYPSSYICPYCGKGLSKTVFHNDYPIHTTEGQVAVPRVFTCLECRAFFAPIPGKKLSEGGYELSGLSQRAYTEIIKEMDKAGSSIGRLDR